MDAATWEPVECEVLTIQEKKSRILDFFPQTVILILPHFFSPRAKEIKG